VVLIAWRKDKGFEYDNLPNGHAKCRAWWCSGRCRPHRGDVKDQCEVANAGWSLERAVELSLPLHRNSRANGRSAQSRPRASHVSKYADRGTTIPQLGHALNRKMKLQIPKNADPRPAFRTGNLQT